MTETTKVAFYYGLRANAHIIDHLVQYDPPMHWVPAIANFNRSRNLSDLMQMGNVSSQSWQAHLIAKYDFDPANPSEQGLLNAGVSSERLSFALETALERAEEWSDPDSFLWSYDDSQPSFLTPAQVEDIIAESMGRGTPVIVFEAPTEDVEKALDDDNSITVRGTGQIYVGLSDPINGYGASASGFAGPITFRPSAEGLTVLGEHAVFEYVVEDAYRATITYGPGEPLQLTTASDDRSRLGKPPVRDERPAPGMKM